MGDNEDVLTMLKVEKRSIADGKTILRFSKALQDILDVPKCCKKDDHRHRTLTKRQ